MTLAFWCILIAALLPYLWVGLAKARPGYNNNAPRDQLERAEGWRKRANWAQLNSFEAFPAFAAAVIVAHLAHAPQARIDLLAGLFIGFRLLHGILYILDKASLRSTVWAGGMACMIGLFMTAAQGG
jgi:uncharacterized MAPEG superfamily protein